MRGCNGEKFTFGEATTSSRSIQDEEDVRVMTVVSVTIPLVRPFRKINP
jgi:hypothetical protein